MADIRVAVIGVGNVGATFVQGVDYYSNPKNTVGLWHQKVAGFRPSSIRIVSAFDINPAKVGKSLAQVATESAAKYHQVRDGKVVVSPGIALDSHDADKATTVSASDFAKALEDSEPDVVLNLISSGMDRTSAEYAKVALKAGAAFVNATPAKIANSALAARFAQKKLVLAGDDLLSQFGGTAFHKGMIDFMVERGVHVSKSYQLDVGGSEETKKTMDERIKMLKRGMKTSSIGLEAPYRFESVAGTTEYTDFLGDSRNSYYWMSSDGFLGAKIIMDLTLRTSDGANAGNVLLDVARAAKARGNVKKIVEAINAYGFKNPPRKAKIRQAYAGFVQMFC
ncbi:L-myo-inositol-1-phosphate synthase [Nitrososphaera sp.]|uniref:L-myo-inositol-1-phosphate synthase n=1 Tax=Nitrososphaera sp. TaxID=1971748 RepID=UPI003173ECB8